MPRFNWRPLRLPAVARELEALGRFCAKEAEELGRPHWPIRGAAALLIVLTNGLSQKIWQKITILEAAEMNVRGN